MSQPDRTGISDITQTDCELGRHAQTETDPDSGASSECDSKFGSCDLKGFVGSTKHSVKKKINSETTNHNYKGSYTF